ncbi:DUF2167 domain-containing protein [Pseudaeromonas paramecii]|uniref:DUF2167 domain-containing protein n=1 Tax=Pseudaeromonas paramecii TaxID=2138166 RepID=A0ABP8QM09_9GAMM
MPRLSALRPLLALFALLLSAPLWALTQEQAQQEFAAAQHAAMAASLSGPRTLTLADQASLELPEAMVYVPAEETRRLMQAINGDYDDSLQGMVLPVSDEEEWTMLLSFDPAGYIRDDDAKEWDPDDMLNSLKEGTEAANQERRQRGIPELEVLGWAEVPAYTASNHQLRWSATARDKGSQESNYTINYKTLALGREGYLGVNLITDTDNVNRLKPVAGALMSQLHFQPGKGYDDFQEGSDKVAEYGLAALVAGVAAKKLGFFALAAAMLAKYAKLLLIGLAGVGALLRRVFKRQG